MTVTEDVTDSYGRTPILFSGVKKVEDIHEWLWCNRNGYMLVMVFNETTSEYVPFGTKVPVYYGDEAIDEIMLYSGMKAIGESEWLRLQEYKRHENEFKEFLKYKESKGERVL